MLKHFNIKGIVVIFFYDYPEYYLCNYATAVNKIKEIYNVEITEQELSKLYIPLEECNTHPLTKEYYE